MPRSDKPISRGSLTDPVTSARSRTWSSHANPEDSNHFEPDGLTLVDPLTQEPLETIVDLTVPAASATPGAPTAPAVSVREADRHVPEMVRIPVYEWTSVRSIEGRTYKRVDERHEVVTDT